MTVGNGVIADLAAYWALVQFRAAHVAHAVSVEIAVQPDRVAFTYACACGSTICETVDRSWFDAIVDGIGQGGGAHVCRSLLVTH